VCFNTVNYYQYTSYVSNMLEKAVMLYRFSHNYVLLSANLKTNLATSDQTFGSDKHTKFIYYVSVLQLLRFYCQIFSSTLKLPPNTTGAFP